MSSFNTIFIASDHAGVQLKDYLQKSKTNYSWVDLGPKTEDSVDYPDFAQDLAKKVLETPGSMGVLICGTGIGMSMAANRFSGIRAALCQSPEEAEATRLHNNANVLCLGARILSENKALDILNKFLTTEFEGGRHLNRVIKIEKFSL